MNLDHLIDSLKDLPEPLIDQVQDYVDFLKTKHAPAAATAEDQFWSLIELIDWEAETEEAMFAPLVEALTASPEAAIFEFQDQLASHLRDLDGPEYFHEFGKGPLGASADSFLYGRCFVVANGKEFYYQVLNNAEDFPQGDELENLLSVVNSAYENKKQKTLERVSDIIYETGHNIEKWGEKAISYA